MDMRATVRRQFARLGYDVKRITGAVGEDPYRDMPRIVANPRPVVADVGANIGQTVERMRAAFEAPEIHSFEASPSTFAELEARVGSLPGVHVVNGGLGSKPGRMELFENTHSDMSSLLEPGAEPMGEVKGRVEIDVGTLDDYAAENEIERFDVLKSDTQGYDLEVLRGAEGLLACGAVGLVFIEINLNRSYKGLPRLDEICGYLFDHGFELVAFYNFHYSGDRVSWADAMFARSAAQ
jgi:FkbM family methyltransferase